MSDSHDLGSRVRGMRERVSGYREAQVYITFARLGIADALAEGPLTLSRLAQACEVDPQALERYVQAAIAFDLLQWDEQGRLALTELGRAAFAPESEYSIANMMRLEGAFYDRWSRLPEAVRTGQRPPENRAQEDDPGWVRMFTLALFDNARQTAPAVASAIDKAIPKVGGRRIRLIDVGGGHGAYSLALAERRPDLEAVVLDLPKVIEVTSEIVPASQHSERVRAVAGDFHVDPLGDDYDAALLFGVLHGETPENAERLLRTIRNALRPSGLLLIRSHGHATDAREPGERELLDLHMLLSTEQGEVRRQLDTSELVINQGFTECPSIEIPAPAGGRLLVFQAPSSGE